MENFIQIRGAALRNLKNVDVDIPRGSITAITGPSGSGKTTLAFGVLGAEARWRLAAFTNTTNSLMAFSRPPTHASSIKNLPPTVQMPRRPRVRSSHSVSSFLNAGRALLSATLDRGKRRCPNCGKPVNATSPGQLLADITRNYDGRAITVSARINTPETKDALNALHLNGFTREIADGNFLELDTEEARGVREIVIDRLTVGQSATDRLRETVLRAYSLEQGGVGLWLRKDETPGSRAGLYSSRGICEGCGYISFEIGPALFESGNYGHALAEPHLEEFLAIEIGGYRLGDLLNSEVGSISWDKVNPELERLAAVMRTLGLAHLNFARPLKTLSSGEAQRIHLIRQLHESQKGLLYILDEPSTSLHPKDIEALWLFLEELGASQQTILMVEHDATLVSRAHRVIRMGPGAGSAGGQVTGYGIETKPALRHSSAVPPKSNSESFIVLRNAYMHNLRNVTLEIPLMRLTGVCGVSGSGKTSLIMRCLVPALMEKLSASDPKRKKIGNTTPEMGTIEFSGGEIERLVLMPDVARSGSRRSVVSTYTGIYDHLRSLYSSLPAARIKGYDSSDFALFNAGKSRSHACEVCGGLGYEQESSSGLEPVTCIACGGARFDDDIQSVTFKGHSISQSLDLEAQAALSVFGAIPEVARRLEKLVTFNLGYLRLGQTVADLSDGEFQRLRLIRSVLEANQRTLFIFDEPTSGLDDTETENLIRLFKELCAAGNTVLAIEHDVAFLRSSDHLIELGPGAGSLGGRVIATGTPQQVHASQGSVTGRFLGSSRL